MIRNPVDDWQELSALYECADELDDAALAVWLDEVAAQEHPLLTQLQRMLAARLAVREGDFLGSLPPLTTTEPVLDGPQVSEGVRIGPYRLLRHIGRGGMAEVWLAQRDDGAFERQVAIKLLFRHASSTERDTFAQRFARERDILASLHHPNIAGLHDAGVTPAGQPWLALEYVEGEPITAWCDKQRLGIEGRVRVFRQVLLAVQHAHANLVIHRDLKPANILVTAEGEVRLLDFGIAKLQEPEGGALAETELTRQHGRPLTLQYASPEQLLGHPLTTSCDVYSLGVALYELLCGERPYELKVQSAAQVEQAILEVEPKPPSRRALTLACAELRGTTPRGLRKTLSGDLDAITLKTMAKRSTERYSSVESLRADLDLWLAGMPVTATSPSAVQRAGKFVKRHVAGVAVGAVAVVALAVVATVAVVMGIRAQAQSARAVASKDFVLDMFRSTDPNESKGAEITAREILKAGQQRAGNSFARQPELQAEILLEIGQVQRNLGNYPEAAQTFAKLVEIHRRSGDTHKRVVVQIDLADIAGRMGDSSGALAQLDALADAAHSFAQDDPLQARFAEVQGRALRNARRLPEARIAMQEALRRAVAAYGESHIRTIDMLRGLAEVESALQEHSLAIAHIEQAAQQVPTTPNVGANDMVGIELERAKIEYLAGHYETASALADRAGKRCDSLLGERAENCSFLKDLQAATYLRLGQWEQASLTLPSLLRTADEEGSPQRQAEALVMACRVLAANGRLPRNGELRSRLEELAVSGPDRKLSDSLKMSALLALGELSLHDRDPAQVEAWVQQFIARQQSVGVTNLPLLARGEVFQGIALQMESKHREALAAFAQADRDLARSIGVDHTLAVLYRLNQARSWDAVGESAHALSLIDGAVTILRGGLGASSPFLRQARALRVEISSGRAHKIQPATSVDFFT